ncbi:MAG: hypothetical protein ROZ37_16385 [Aromatoleum sp.]|jgi:hypothetical protein|uniref:hypothetical protein n=1 Tax=Aromatoleum sp. TaxID=2307007 RepID=UPI0028947594|nr:hypothetical protein [Aromatoleum sp.]MDT3671897.1 hypothetical protein [Aromatoleum sp.]
MDAALRRLEDAVDREDWADAADADVGFACALSRFLGTELSQADRDALTRAREVHAGLRHRCEAACTRLEAHIAKTRAHKEGWIAYAMSAEPRETGA